MIQSAHIGFGIQGNEGNQASSFSDYSITQFQDLNQMIFWHGRCFAWKASNFTMWFVFKGMLFSVPILFFNTQCGYSGTTYVEDYYFALYEVILTTFAIYFYLLIDQDVSFADRFNQKVRQLIPKLYSYKISSQLNHKLSRFCFYSLYAWYCGFLAFFIPFLAMNDLVNSRGKTGGLWSSGLASFSVVIFTHHAMIFIGTRNYTYVTFTAYLFSLNCFIPITMLLNEYTKGTSTYRTTFSDILGGTALYWLSVLIVMAMTCLPLYLVKSFEMVWASPDKYLK
uniref:P-type ATPase C-terminal domain-containing protein n=1 Tax=Strombidium rassoulzadegani TaxID=1082188 RepID=A0A7S3FV57_9SPIT|mmetsp:Transcript_18873/g.32241  ORF Transcript_18873/g.32241 Transcript_18873/m.32241 type:complete len:282 (+) Transcript_18873:115-960(+)